jgi:hypothetical protein
VRLPHASRPAASRAAALLLTLACSGAPDRAAPAPAEPTPAPAHAALPGALWVLTGQQLSRLDHAGASAVADGVSAVSLTPGGDAWWASGSKLTHQLETGLTETHALPDSPTSDQVLALHAPSDRELWVATGSRLLYLRESRVQDERTVSLPEPLGPVEQITVSREGTVYLRSAEVVAKLTPAGLVLHPLVETAPRLIASTGLALASDDSAWLSYMSELGPGLLVEQAGVWYDTGHAASARRGATTLTVHPSGSPAAIDRSQTGFFRLLGGEVHQTPVLGPRTVSQELTAISFDAHRRAWLAGDAGLLVVDEREQVLEWSWQALGLPAGPVRGLWVTASGPALPPAQPATNR